MSGRCATLHCRTTTVRRDFHAWHRPAAHTVAGDWHGDSIWKGIEEVQPADVDALGPDTSVSRHLLRRAVDRVRPRLVLSGHWHQRLSHVLPDDIRCEVLDMNGRVNNAVILELSSLDLTEMADLDPAWHRWTRGAEKNYQHKKANVRFNQLAAQPRADGLSETDARKNASSILQDQGID